jgi:hypothetical protein
MRHVVRRQRALGVQCRQERLGAEAIGSARRRLGARLDLVAALAERSGRA